MRVFFDTNVLVSAFLTRGLCADLLRLVLTEHTLVTSEGVLANFFNSLLSKKTGVGGAAGGGSPGGGVSGAALPGVVRADGSPGPDDCKFHFQSGI